LYEKNPWIAQSLHKAFTAAKSRAYALYDQTAALPAMVPWLLAELEEARREMGADWWPYGLEPNRKVLETFLRYHHEQGLSKRLFKPEELFARETLASYKL
jgi:4,5-dihydroxyphthalate decarboxylase